MNECDGVTPISARVRGFEEISFDVFECFKGAAPIREGEEASRQENSFSNGSFSIILLLCHLEPHPMARSFDDIPNEI